MTVMTAPLNFQGQINRIVKELRFSCLSLRSQYSGDKCWLGKTFALYPGNLGRRLTCVQKPTLKIQLNNKSFLKENHVGRGSSLFSTLYRLSSDWLGVK